MAARQFEMYSCCSEDCGLVMEIVQPECCDHAGEFTCCGRTMELLEARTADFKTEKHVPVVEKVPGGVKVTVGSTPHPMEEDHWIQFIEVRSANGLYRRYLKPGDAPEATFPVDIEKVDVAREHCNKHGLWKN